MIGSGTAITATTAPTAPTATTAPTAITAIGSFRAFMIGALSALLIVVIILFVFWYAFALPWLHGVTYNMQLDEAALRQLGINPTSDFLAMWDQVIRLGRMQ